MTRISAIFVGGLLLSGASLGAAHAQAIYPVHSGGQLLPPQQVASIVRSLNFQPIAPAMLHGDRYAVRVVDRDGYPSIVWIDALRGDVVSITPSQAVASDRTWEERRFASREEIARPLPGVSAAPRISVVTPPPKAVVAPPLPDKPPIPRARPELAANSAASPGPASPPETGRAPPPAVEHSPIPLPTQQGPGQPPPPGSAPVQGFE